MINIEEYIDNEIIYIETNGLPCDKQDLKDLYSLTKEDIKNIQNEIDTDSVLSNEIDNLLREAANYWLYHYIEKKKESK